MPDSRGPPATGASMNLLPMPSLPQQMNGQQSLNPSESGALLTRRVAGRPGRRTAHTELRGGLQHPLVDAGHRPLGRQAALFGPVRPGAVWANKRHQRRSCGVGRSRIAGAGLRPTARLPRATPSSRRSGELGVEMKFAGPTTSVQLLQESVQGSTCDPCRNGPCQSMSRPCIASCHRHWAASRTRRTAHPESGCTRTKSSNPRGVRMRRGSKRRVGLVAFLVEDSVLAGP